MKKKTKIPQQAIPQEIRKIANVCLSHAQDLITAAKRIQKEETLPNIAYHLAVIAMEEIGKAELVAMNYFAKKHKESAWVEKYFGDHIKKLFWSIWGPSIIGREIITRNQIQIYQNLAQKIHETRLRGLYVDVEEYYLPRETITELEAKSLISLASARLELKKTQKFKPLNRDKQLTISWFLDATENEENRRYIFGAESMKKLAEFDWPYEWIKWLKQQFEDAESNARELAERELKRTMPKKKEELQHKWKLKIRFYTSSHSIRPKPLNWWNEKNNWIKLYPVNRKKNELLTEFILPKAVPLKGIWLTGWAAARRFITALNIGSLGFFWWYIPKQVSRYYEDLKDMENDARLIVERSPKLVLDWKRDALTEQDLRNASLCFAMLPLKDEKDKHEPFSYYLTGLGFFSKNDIHLQFEANAFEQFYKSLKSAMYIYEDWDGVKPFAIPFNAFMSEVIRNEKERKKFIKLGEQFEDVPVDPSGITLTEVGEMKLLCDAFFLKIFHKLAKKRIRNELSKHSKK